MREFISKNKTLLKNLRLVILAAIVTAGVGFSWYFFRINDSAKSPEMDINSFPQSFSDGLISTSSSSSSEETEVKSDIFLYEGSLYSINSQGEYEVLKLVEGEIGWIEKSPDGKYLAFATIEYSPAKASGGFYGPEEAYSLSAIYEYNMDTEKVVKIADKSPNIENGVYDSFPYESIIMGYSPDSRYLAYSQKEIRIYDKKNGNTLTSSADGSTNAHWNKDSNILVTNFYAGASTHIAYRIDNSKITKLGSTNPIEDYSTLEGRYRIERDIEGGTFTLNKVSDKDKTKVIGKFSDQEYGFTSELNSWKNYSEVFGGIFIGKKVVQSSSASDKSETHARIRWVDSDFAINVSDHIPDGHLLYQEDSRIGRLSIGEGPNSSIHALEKVNAIVFISMENYLSFERSESLSATIIFLEVTDGVYNVDESKVISIE